MKAVLRKIRISPKKVNLVAGIVRGKKVTEALALLKFMPKKAAALLYKVVHSAASNAKTNFSQSIDDLYITKILVTKGPTYKRSLPISRGRTHPIHKRTAHVTVEVGIKEAEEKVTKKGKESDVEKKKPATKKVTKAAKADAPAKETTKKETTKQ